MSQRSLANITSEIACIFLLVLAFISTRDLGTRLVPLGNTPDELETIESLLYRFSGFFATEEGAEHFVRPLYQEIANAVFATQLAPHNVGPFITYQAGLVFTGDSLCPITLDPTRRGIEVTTFRNVFTSLRELNAVLFAVIVLISCLYWSRMLPERPFRTLGLAAILAGCPLLVLSGSSANDALFLAALSTVCYLLALGFILGRLKLSLGSVVLFVSLVMITSFGAPVGRLVSLLIPLVVLAVPLGSARLRVFFATLPPVTIAVLSGLFFSESGAHEQSALGEIWSWGFPVGTVRVLWMVLILVGLSCACVSVLFRAPRRKMGTSELRELSFTLAYLALSGLVLVLSGTVDRAAIIFLAPPFLHLIYLGLCLLVKTVSPRFLYTDAVLSIMLLVVFLVTHESIALTARETFSPCLTAMKTDRVPHSSLAIATGNFREGDSAELLMIHLPSGRGILVGKDSEDLERLWTGEFPIRNEQLVVGDLDRDRHDDLLVVAPTGNELWVYSGAELTEQFSQAGLRVRSPTRISLDAQPDSTRVFFFIQITSEREELVSFSRASGEWLEWDLQTRTSKLLWRTFLNKKLEQTLDVQPLVLKSDPSSAQLERPFLGVYQSRTGRFELQRFGSNPDLSSYSTLLSPRLTLYAADLNGDTLDDLISIPAAGRCPSVYYLQYLKRAAPSASGPVTFCPANGLELLRFDDHQRLIHLHQKGQRAEVLSVSLRTGLVSVLPVEFDADALSPSALRLVPIVKEYNPSWFGYNLGGAQFVSLGAE